jgi:hypothetical protein
MKILALRGLALAAVVSLGGAPAVAADPVNINIVLIPSESAAQAYYAQDLGYFKAAGLNVTLTSMAASPPIIAAVSSEPSTSATPSSARSWRRVRAASTSNLLLRADSIQQPRRPHDSSA